MEYFTTEEAAMKWGISRRRVNMLCTEGIIEEAICFGAV